MYTGTISVAITTFIATIGLIDVATMFAGITAGLGNREKRVIAFRGTMIATAILMVFALLCETLLVMLGISLAAFRTAGGILLLLIAIEMVFARTSGATSATPDETKEATDKRDIAVFPLATPLIAGPGAIGATILLMANSQQNIMQQALVCSSLLAVLLLTFLCLLAATQLHRLLGITGIQVISRIFGVLLTALAVQFIFDGIAESSLGKGYKTHHL